MRLESEKLVLIDAELVGFITSMAGLQPVARRLLQVDGDLLSHLVTDSSPALKQAWKVLVRQQLKKFSVGNCTSKNPGFVVTQALVGVAVVLNNRVALRGDFLSNESELITLHDRALLNFLPVPRSTPDILSFDLLLSAYFQFLRTEAEPVEQDPVSLDLLNFSTFTSLKFFDFSLPRPLVRIAPDYLSHWPNIESAGDEVEWWNLVDEILCQPDLTADLRNAWLELPENRLSCLGLGVFLEEIRRRGQYDNLILSFFEAYEFLQKIPQSEPEKEPVYLLGLISSQLSASGDCLSGRRLNQVGNEYFLKFRALLEIVAARGGVPGEFRHLSHDFCFNRLLPLVAMATITGGQRLDRQTPAKFSEVKFS